VAKSEVVVMGRQVVPANSPNISLRPVGGP
jgi:hypothetical protein